MFRIGDRVTWVDTRYGEVYRKVGVVHTVVPPGVVPKFRQVMGPARATESYVIRGRTDRGQLHSYWPKVSKLQKEKR